MLQYGPGIIFSISLIIFGWVIALIIRKIVTKLLRAFGFDVLSEKIGFKRFLAKGGIEKNPSSIIGWIFYWIIFINALIMAQDAVDLKVTSQFLQNIVLYIPNVIVVIIILALGMYVSRFIARFVDKTAHLASISIHGLLGTGARYIVIGFTIMMVLDYLNVSSFVMSESLTIIFAIIPVAFFLVFVIGGRDVISNILNGRFLVQEFKKGDKIESDSISGRIDSVGPIYTNLINDKEEKIIVPNTELAKKIIKKSR